VTLVDGCGAGICFEVVVGKSRSFIYFPRLLPELRRQVWEQASFYPRDVDITASFGRPQASQRARRHSNSISLPLHLSASCSIISEPRVRSEGLKWYTLDFGTRSVIYSNIPSFKDEDERKPQIYINWNTDRICLVNWGVIANQWWKHAWQDFKERCKKNGLRRLACNLQGYNSEMSVREFLKSCVEVQEIGFSGVKCYCMLVRGETGE